LLVRPDGRSPDELRPVIIHRDYIMHAEGSVLIEVGNTKVICTASCEDRVPPFLKGTGQGWISSEYGMLPRATPVRNARERTGAHGRTFEIQRLIGRSLRSVVDLFAFGERTIWIDCDVIQADGGTRTASITGSFVALVDAFYTLREKGFIDHIPVNDFVAAISVGLVQDVPVLDLCYEEDSRARVDMNVVMTGTGDLVEVQGTGEQSPFSRQEMNTLLSLAQRGISRLVQLQREVLGKLSDEIGGE